MKKKIRKRRLTKEGKMLTAGAVAVIVLLALGAFFFLFRVDNVYVVGSTRYTDDQIKEYVLTTPMTSNHGSCDALPETYKCRKYSVCEFL